MKQKTDELLKTLNQSSSVSQLTTYIDVLKQEIPYQNVGEFLNVMLEEKQLKKSDVINASHLDRTYAYQIFNATRTGSRNKILAISVAMHLTLDEVNRALTINGDNILYAKNIRDAILIYALNKQLSLYETNILLDQKGEQVLDV